MTNHEDAVRATITAVAHHIDAKRWTELRALYAADVDTDYNSLFGGTPQRQSGDALVATRGESGWRITGMTLETMLQLGNSSVLAEAS